MKQIRTNRGDFIAIARRILTQPTAPYHEHGVRTQVEDYCRERGLKCTRDPFGNLLIRYERGKSRPVVLAAHMDHPAFSIQKRIGRGRYLAEFRGGVAKEYFRAGTRVRLQPGNVAARLGKAKAGAEKVFELETRNEPETAPEFGTWDLPAFRCRGDKIVSSACDDLIGVVAVLSAMGQLKAAGGRVNVIGALSRAEEVGFRGALGIAADRELPRKALVISLETSREIAGVKMGKGMILRTGDKASVFGSAPMRYLGSVAEDFSKQTKEFAFQRALMSGGTCEATAYQEFGYESGAVCVALGNYHNQGGSGKIAAEHVSLSDACGMTDFLMEVVRRMRDYDRLVSALPERLKRNWKDARELLIKTR